jgi:hypothetical protein
VVSLQKSSSLQMHQTPASPLYSILISLPHPAIPCAAAAAAAVDPAAVELVQRRMSPMMVQNAGFEGLRADGGGGLVGVGCGGRFGG